MKLLANVLLGLAALVTVLVALLVADARPASGPDAMGLVVVPMLLTPRWLALAAATGIAARRRALDWVHPARAVQATAGVVWLGLLGVASITSVFMAYGTHAATFKPWALVVAVAVPALVIAGTAVRLNGRPGPSTQRALWRLAAGLVSLVVAWGSLVMWRVDWADRRAGLAAQEVAAAERARWLAEQQRKFDALSPRAPLGDWLPWLNVSPEFRDPAVAAVRARPTLEQDVAQMLRSGDAPAALRFMWLWMPDPPASLAAPARDAIATLPGWAEQYLANPPPPERFTAHDDGSPEVFPPPNPVDLSDMAQAAIVIADKYAASGLDFETPIRAFADALARHARPEAQMSDDVTYLPRSYVQTWLEGKPSSHVRPK